MSPAPIRRDAACTAVVPNLERILRNRVAGRADFAFRNCRNAGWRGEIDIVSCQWTVVRRVVHSCVSVIQTIQICAPRGDSFDTDSQFIWICGNTVNPTDGVAIPRMKKRIFRHWFSPASIRGIATLSVGHFCPLASSSCEAFSCLSRLSWFPAFGSGRRPGWVLRVLSGLKKRIGRASQ